MPKLKEDSVDGSGLGLFYGCKSLKKIHLPLVERVGREVAYECDSLEEVYMPNCTNFGFSAAFYQCKNLQRVTFGKETKRLVPSMFNGCENLVSVEPFLPLELADGGYFPNPAELAAYRGKIFLDCRALAQPLVLKSGTLETILQFSFCNCTNLSDITLDLPALKTIESQAFNSIAPGGQIKWLSDTAPETLGSIAITSTDSANPPVIRLSSQAAVQAWRPHCTRLRKPKADETALTSADLALASYPGDKTIGIIDSNKNLAWVVCDYAGGTVILMR